jgi:divalent metal cation (Fe/Co/Zn/Cd) transporter
MAVQANSGHLSVSVDLEVEGNMPLRAAHDVASGLEEAVREEIGPDVEVDTHIKPPPADVVAGQDAPPTRIAEVTQLRGSLPRILLGSMKSMTCGCGVRAPDGGIVNFRCSVDPALSVRAVHDLVDAAERRLRLHFPAIQRVICHAEPRR